MTEKSKLDLEAIKANKNIAGRTYWKDRLDGFILEDYFGKSNVTKLSENENHFNLVAEDQLFTILNTLADSKKAKHIILLSVLGIIAQKYSSRTDIGVFTSFYLENETLNALDSVIPVRMNDFESLTFPQFLTTLKNNIINDFKHSDYPLERIMNKDVNQLNQLFTIGMIVEGLQEETTIKVLSSDFLFVFNVEDKLSLKIVYKGTKYDQNYIESIGKHYFHLLNELITNKGKQIKEIELITNEEKNKIVNEFNQTKKAFPSDKTILDFFTEQVIKTPNNVAVQFKNKQLSYKELDEKSNQVANFLKEKFYNQGNVIGVQLERSIELMVVIFGILKAGSVYLPLSKSHPKERVAYTLKNSNAKAIFTESENFKDFESELECLDLNEAYIQSVSSINLAKPNDIAYIIYTSGSTGRPKGVQIKHVSMVNRLNWMQNEYQLDEKDIILQKTPLVFDVSIWELFLWSMSGAKLVLAAPGVEKNPQEICELIENEKITVLHFVPSMLNALFVYLTQNGQEYTLKSIKNLFTSGEELKVGDAKKFLDYCPNADLHNLYGPTEATVDVSFHKVLRSVNYRSIPIGKPIDNTQLYICNDHLQHQPIGIPGELLIGGVNLSIGYVGQPELTKERFIENSFDKGTFLYKTGDLAKWSPEGNIEFLGRIDNQVKIRGNRIELGEIEFTIQSFESVKGAVVLAKETINGTQLIGYLVTSPDFSENKLRDFLELKLPEYMMPSYFIKIDEIPVTVNGKVDRENLLSLQMQVTDEYVAPETEIEKQLHTYWSTVLSESKIGINSSFFRIGGDSILAIKLIGTINNRLSTNISMIDLYENDTIKKLANFIILSNRDDFSDAYINITNEVEQFNTDYKEHAKNDLIENVYPMSDIEKAMCFIHKSRPDDILYFEQLMQPVAYETLDMVLLQKALDLLVDKHEILRTGFDINNFAHIVYKKVETTIQFLDYSSLDKKEQKRRIEEDMEKSRPAHFDLQAEKLWRIIIYKLKESHHEILFEYHHAIIDGWSFASLLTELNNTYVSLLKNDVVKLNKLETSFKDYIIQELFYKQNQATIDFWKNDLKGFKRLKLNKSTDEKVFKSVRDVYPTKLLTDLENVAKRKETSVKNILLSAYIYSMKMLSGENDILVGLVTFTRPLKKDGEKLLGCFLNTIPFRIKIPNGITWNDYISLIDKKILEVKKHEHLSLFEINQAVGGGNVGNPLFDTFFNYINWHVKDDMELAETIDDDSERIYFDTFLRGNTFFDVNYDVTNKKIICMHEYSSPFMTEETYSQYNNMFLSVLERIIKASDEIINPQDFFWNSVIEDLDADLQNYKEINSSFDNLMSVSDYQEELWSDDMKSGRGNNHNISLVTDFKGELNNNLLKESIQNTINKHDLLRARIVQIEGKYFHEITDTNEFGLNLKILHAKNEIVSDLIKEEINKPFNLDESLVRFTIIQLEPKISKLIIVFHNSIVDYQSVKNVTNEILSSYQSKESKMNDNKVSTLQYSGFMLWQQKTLSKLLPNLLDYWKNQLKGAVKEFELPFDKTKELKGTFITSNVAIDIPKIIVEKVLNYEKEHGIKANVILMAVFKILLHKYSQHEEIIIGTSAANRSGNHLKDLIGPLSNTLAIRSFIEQETNFDTYLKSLNRIYKEGLEHQSLPFDLLLNELFGENYKHTNNSLFDIFYEYEDIKNVHLVEDNLEVNFGKIDNSFEKYDLCMSLKNDGASIMGKLKFNLDSFSFNKINSLLEHFYGLIENLIDRNYDKLSSIGILSKREELKLIDDFNSSFRAYPDYENIISLFESQVIKTPENIALRYSDSEMSYSELSHKINNFSDYLLEDKGVKVGEVVGVMLEREAYLIPTLFGILKSGGAYLPIDVTLPKDRIETIIKDSKISKLITRAEHLDSLESLSVEIIDLNQVIPNLIGRQSSGLQAKVNPNDLAYVIYTSGSTGIPKGVMIEHGSLLNIVQSMDNRYPLTATDSYLLKTTYSFDVSVAELFGWFHAGGSLTLLPSGSEKDPNKILSCIEKNKVTHVSFVPSMFSFFIDTIEKEGIDKIRNLKYLFLAGESLPIELVNRFNALKTTIALENIYGPTEATIYSSVYSTSNLKDAEKVSIGKPLNNIHLYVLDQWNNLQPIGVPGELCIGGKALARGYLHNSELTAAKFIHVTGLPEERIYKTGDLVRWQQDGNIEYLGRIDNQVKIRGFRIELGDIESQLNKVQGVEQSAVVLKEKEGDKYLVAYYQSNKEIDQAKLKQHLLDKLPEYMVPSYYVYLKNFPLTSSGKLSRKDLPEPEIKRGNNYKAPSNVIEEKLVAIWSEVLKLDKELISVDRSFFELGGHSLKAMVLVNKIAKELEITLPLEQVFEQSTIEKQAEFIEINKWLDDSSNSEIEEEMTESIII